VQVLRVVCASQVIGYRPEGYAPRCSLREIGYRRHLSLAVALGELTVKGQRSCGELTGDCWKENRVNQAENRLFVGGKTGINWMGKWLSLASLQLTTHNEMEQNTVIMYGYFLPWKNITIKTLYVDDIGNGHGDMILYGFFVWINIDTFKGYQYLQSLSIDYAVRPTTNAKNHLLDLGWTLMALALLRGLVEGITCAEDVKYEGHRVIQFKKEALEAPVFLAKSEYCVVGYDLNLIHLRYPQTPDL
jgi:hypothetical protein